MIDFDKIANDKSYLQVCKNICGTRKDLVYDLHQHVLMMFLEMSEEQQNKIQDVKWYYVRLCINEFRGARSKFRKIYNHGEEVLETDKIKDEPEEDSNEELDKIYSSYLDTLNNISWYDREIWKLYLVDYSIRKISAKTKIPVMSVHESLSKTKQNVRRNYEILSTGSDKSLLVGKSFPDLFGN